MRLIFCQHRCQGSLCLVWSFKFLFSAGLKPKQICSRDTSQDISDRSTLMCYDFMTFMISLQLAKIWGRFPHVCVDEDYLALKRIPSWSLQCCRKSTIWKMPWYLNSKNCTQTETDLPDSATLFASHGIGSVRSHIYIYIICLVCIVCFAMPSCMFFASGDALKKMMRKSKAGLSLDFGPSC